MVANGRFIRLRRRALALQELHEDHPFVQLHNREEHNRLAARQYRSFKFNASKSATRLPHALHDQEARALIEGTPRPHEEGCKQSSTADINYLQST